MFICNNKHAIMFKGYRLRTAVHHSNWSDLNRAVLWHRWGKTKKVPFLKLSWQIFCPLQLQQLFGLEKPAQEEKWICLNMCEELKKKFVLHIVKQSTVCICSSVCMFLVKSASWVILVPFHNRLSPGPAAAQSTLVWCSLSPGWRWSPISQSSHNLRCCCRDDI